MKCDSGVTVDAVRILRVPGTKNYKSDPALPVTLIRDDGCDVLLDDVCAALEPYMGRPEISPASGALTAPDVNDELSAGIGDRATARLRKIDDVIKACRWIKLIVETAGAGQDNTLWHYGLTVAERCENPHDVAHRMSNGHETYSETETQQEIERVQREYASKDGRGFTKCATISAAGATECAGCPFRDLGKSPLSVPGALPSVVASVGTFATDATTLPPGTHTPAEAIAHMNHNYFVSLIDGVPSIFHPEAEGTLTLSNVADLATFYSNRFVKTGMGKDEKETPLIRFWMPNENRREFSRVVMKERGKEAPGEYNLYRGLSVERKEGTDKAESFLDHVWVVVARQNDEIYNALLNFFAWCVQNPFARANIGLVLKSVREGTGKSTVLEVMLEIFGKHALLIADKGQLLGKFNAHLENKLLVACEEIMLAGDGRTADALKNLVTASEIIIERKHQGTYPIPNALKIMFATNHDHAIHAGVGARRWFVLDVSDEKTGDKAWFDKIYHDLNNGGREQFLNILLERDLGEWHPRDMPRTEETGKQQRKSGGSIIQWLMACVDADCIVGDLNSPALGKAANANTPAEMAHVGPTLLYAAYCDFTTKSGGRKDNHNNFGDAIKLILGREKRATTPDKAGKRPRYYEVPDADTLSDLIEANLRTPK